MMSRQQKLTKHQKRHLHRERAQIVREIAHLEQAIQTEIEVGVDEGDVDVTNQETYTTLRSTLERRLHEVDQALHAIEQGTYGICARCGNPIEPARLEAKPEAQYCVSCQAVVEAARHETI
jgi:DnaK suppressor protein